ncbi:MAG: glutamine-hydrolyzing GMP synthase [bacterium]
MPQTDRELIIILDFGSQYTQLIARRIREQKVYCEILPCVVPLAEVEAKKPRGIVLSGGPWSVYSPEAPAWDPKVFELRVPVLGICYGLQLMGHALGGEVQKATRREYGRAKLFVDDDTDLFCGLGRKLTVWMSHGDRLTKIPQGFEVIGHTDNGPIAAIRHPGRKIYGVQFHPEVVHTPKGKEILHNFLFRICGCSGTWTPASFVQESVKAIRERVGEKKVISALSGGVDSSVVAVLIHRAVGDRLTCIFVDNGVLRYKEAERVMATFRDHFHIDVRFVDASDRFLNRLEGITDPEEKRKAIGTEFIRVFEEEAKKLGKIDLLAQGTLYPDLIESTSFKGPSATIKSHHNVGGLPEEMDLELIEPLRELFKDEVRAVGQELGLPDEILGRHPFPGPGLAVRILGEVTRERVALLQQADEIFIEELQKANWYQKVWQALAVLLPVRSVGVMGDERTYEHVVALRAVTSLDGMTADWAKVPPDLLGKVSNRIINEIEGINRVVYDISSKPPSTIEWE